MSGGIEAAGDIATGALIGRAIEPHSGEPGHGEAHGACLNCGTALHGEFCHACGQAAHVHRSLASIGHDLLHGVFHFEGKIWRTLPMLVTRPGSLTRRYIAGERARFVSPLALFLFMAFLLFAVIHALAGELEVPEKSHEERVATVQKLDKQINEAEAELRTNAAKRAAAVAAGQSTVEFDAKRASLEPMIGGLKAGRDASAAEDDGETGKSSKLSHVDTGWARLDHGIVKANANPSLALYKLQMSAYKFSWALIPISVPFVALLFLWRRRYKLYDHAIFVTYSLSFMMLLVITLSIVGALGVNGGWIAIPALIVPPFHMYKQLRGAYELKRFSALWRTAALLVFAFIALLAFMLLLLGMGLME